MFDTLRLSFHVPLPKGDKQYWKPRSKFKQDGFTFLSNWFRPVAPNGYVFQATYFPVVFKQRKILNLEFSLPMMIFGNNVEEISDLEAAIREANSLVNGIAGIPEIDLAKGLVKRIDFSKNHFVGDQSNGYIHYLSQQQLPYRLTRTEWENESVVFDSQSGRTTFYDKHAQSGDKSAWGLLRQEMSFRKTGAIERTFGKYVRLGEISNGYLASLLQQNLAKLGLNQTILDPEIMQTRLIEHYGSKKGAHFMNMLDLRTKFSPYLINEMEGRGNRYVQNIVRQLVKDCFPPGLALPGEPLPPLTINSGGQKLAETPIEIELPLGAMTDG